MECLDHKNILIRDKNGVYGVIDGADGTEVYRIKGVDALSFGKSGVHLYKDKNKTYTAEDLNKKIVRMIMN